MSLIPNVLRQSGARLVQGGFALVVAVVFAGCGSAYRPVITPINPSGPPQQPTGYAVVISSPSSTAAGVATVIDYSGDTIMTQATIGPNPFAFTLDATGTNGYTVNSDHTLTNFQVSQQQPQEKDIHYSTLPVAAQTVGLFSPTTGLWVSDLNQNVIDVLAPASAAQSFKLAIPVAPTPIGVVGIGTIGQHVYSISQNVPFDIACNVAPASVAANGEADALEVSSYTVSARIPLGKCPVYGVESSDGRRLFVLNRGSDSVTVIDSQKNALDQCTPFLNQNGQQVTCHPSLALPAGSGPVYAEYIPSTQQLVVANYAGNSISLIDVSLDEYGNDSQTFGTTFTIPVGHNPASVTVLSDGSRAYTANQTDGTVTIVNLSSHTVEKTLQVTGHPRTVVSTSNSLYGKVYVASPDSTFLTILRTDQDIVDTVVLIQGNLVDVRTTNHLPNGIDEPVVEKGSTLSSGQRQLISFARALAFDPAILILDEATSNIDTETEEIIQHAMDVLKKGRTTFIIAHRLSTIKNADRILVLDRGEIVESGSHDELLVQGGQYAQMYKLQAGTSGNTKVG